MKIFKLSIILLVVMVSMGLATEVKKELPKKTLIFFQNPYGRPCQYQLEIINGISDSLKKYCKIEHVRTDVSADREKFGTWGVRGIPLLVVVDNNRKEIFRFAPGVQDDKVILEKLRTLK